VSADWRTRRGQLNMGMGESSFADMAVLNSQLHEAYGHLNTIQQARYPEDEEAHGDATMAVAQIAAKIHERLTGIRLSSITVFKQMEEARKTGWPGSNS
jgi:hypothetical protein